MFLHSGASLHGHEYSNRRSASSSSPQPPHTLRSPPLRSSTSGPIKSPLITTSVAGQMAPVRRKRAVSELPRAPSPIVRFQNLDEEGSVSEMNEDAGSESDFSDTTAAMSMDGVGGRPLPRRRRHRTQRKSTTYFLGYPAPKPFSKKKLAQKVLPRLLLQLQKVSEDGRSRPVLEVFPSSRIAGPVIAPRLAKRFPGIIGVKRQLGYDDVVLIRRDDSESVTDAESDCDESLEKGMLLAIYSPLKNSDDAEIVLDDGTVWLARPTANGSYDFVHVDEQGNTTTARWARRNPTSSSAAYLPTDTYATATSPSTPPQSRFTFSIINPLSRRHPVLASLTQSTLDVHEAYTSVSPSCSRYPPMRPITNRTSSMTTIPQSAPWSRTPSVSRPKLSSVTWTTDGDSDAGDTFSLPTPSAPSKLKHTIDDSTKCLISVTALWVALRSGWSPNYTPPSSSEPAALSPSSSTRASRRNTWSRTTTTSDICGAGRLTPQQLSESETPSQPKSACPSTKGKRYSMPAQLTQAHDSLASVVQPPSRSPTPVLTTIHVGPRRATSTGAAFMQRHLHLPGADSKHHSVGAGHPLGPAILEQLDCRAPAAKAEKAGKEGGSAPSVGIGGVGGGDGGDGGGKKGFRSRLVKWIHRLGAR
ncbi:hypothetical protein B0T22DRAFT_370965 [Podospora appendiculata]|uniref:Uncharacterized protein n=1 Tax=Podospora appendiculata TaxID=314037 RepID=A0AAE1CF62_9PEZI|nr:hypothetical protein B0T22DRAFT_370965 [Podospora appendiculata]